jgi:hypothetical protein
MLRAKANHGVGGRKDRLRRSIIPLKRDDFGCGRKLSREVENVAHRGGTKRIDRLGIIADDGQATPSGLQGKKDRGLEPVCVLVLINENMIEAAADLAGKAWVADHLGPVEQQVIVIENILTLLFLDISGE